MQSRCLSLIARRSFATDTALPPNLIGRLPDFRPAQQNPFLAVQTYLSQFSVPPLTVDVKLDTLTGIESDQTISLPAAIFAHPCHSSLFHLLVKQHLAGLRQGTHANKSRHEVAYSNRKIRKQKGNGKSRLGDKGSPMLRGGGRAFAKKPRDYSFHVPNKMVQKGIKGALSMRLAMSELFVIPDVDLGWTEGKTKLLYQALRQKQWTEARDRGTLFILGQESLASPAGQLFEQASRNLPQATVIDALDSLNVYGLLQPSRLVLDKHAVTEICQRFSTVEIERMSPNAAQDSIAV